MGIWSEQGQSARWPCWLRGKGDLTSNEIEIKKDTQRRFRTIIYTSAQLHLWLLSHSPPLLFAPKAPNISCCCGCRRRRGTRRAGDAHRPTHKRQTTRAPAPRALRAVPRSSSGSIRGRQRIETATLRERAEGEGRRAHDRVCACCAGFEGGGGELAGADSAEAEVA